MLKPVIDQGRYVPALINFVANKLAAGASSAYRREFGVGVTEWRILSLLAIESPCAAQRICQYFDLDKGLVSRTTRMLVENGSVTVTEQAGDTKRTITLTKAGRALHDRMIKLALERERMLLSCLKDKEVDLLIEMLRRLLVQVPAVNAVQSRKANGTGRKASAKLRREVKSTG